MLLKIQKLKAEASYTRLISEHAHKFLPVRKIRFIRYVDGHTACTALNLTHNKLVHYLRDSYNVHGLLLDNGQVFIHPDGFIAQLKSESISSLQAYYDAEEATLLKVT